MKRFKLKHGYHDGLVTAALYPGNADVVLNVTLCACCNVSPGPAVLWFSRVRNLDEVRQALEAARRANASRTYIDEIIGILRDDRRGYLLDLAVAGGVRVDTQGLYET